MSHDEIKQIRELITNLDEKMVQQRSAHQSDFIKQLQSLETKFDARLDALEKKLDKWDTATKVGLAVFIGIGAVITWSLNVFGVKIGIK